jgi:hypothetical protein
MPKIAPSNEETEARLAEIAREVAEAQVKLTGTAVPAQRDLLKQHLRMLMKERHILRMRIRVRRTRNMRSESLMFSRASSEWSVSHSKNIRELKLFGNPEAISFKVLDYPLVRLLSKEEVQSARATFKASMAELSNGIIAREVDEAAKKTPVYQGKQITCPRCACPDARLIDIKKQAADVRRRKRLLAEVRLKAAETSFATTMKMVEDGEATAEGLDHLSKNSGEKAKLVYRAHFLRIFINARVSRCNYADVNPNQKRGPVSKPRLGYCLVLPLDVGEANCTRWHAVYVARTRKEISIWTHRQVIKGYRSAKELLATEELLAAEEEEGEDSSAGHEETDGSIGGRGAA